MKKYLISVVIWYVLLSIAIAIIWILTGMSGSVIIRLIVALVLAYFKPIDKMPWKQS